MTGGGFLRPNIISVIQPTVSKHWRKDIDAFYLLGGAVLHGCETCDVFIDNNHHFITMKASEWGWWSSPCYHDLDLGSGQGHISMHKTCRTTSIPTEKEIPKLGSDKLQTRSHIIIINHQFSAPRQNGEGDRPRKVQVSELQKLSDLDLDLGSGWCQTGGQIWSRSTHTSN